MTEPTQPRPARAQRLDKRVRVRKCLGKLRVPTQAGRAEVVFECQLERHDPATPHECRGIVFMKNQTFREFTVTWHDQGVADLYQEAKLERNKRATRSRNRDADTNTKPTLALVTPT